jgi:hypothetical protein
MLKILKNFVIEDRAALLDRGAARQETVTEAPLELVLTTGERLRIGAGVGGSARLA